MKNLILVRHGKSDWSHEGLPDIDRPLNQRGYTDAYRMAKELIEEIEIPDLFVCSPAVRALTTGLIFAAELKIDKSTILIEPALYDSSAEQYLEIVKAFDDNKSSAILFGHNPSCSDFYTLFTAKLNDLPTCAILILKSSSEKWSQLSAENTKVVAVKTPKHTV